MSYYPDDPRARRRQKRRSMFSGMKLRLLIGAAIILFSLFRFYSKGQTNPITGKTQRVDLTIDQEIRMGLQSAPSMGQPSSDRRKMANVEEVGRRLQTRFEQMLYKREPPVRNPYNFEFHLLSDRQTINAFALPGGQVFITEALYNKLENDDQLAGVLGHEIGHVIERHSSERMAKGNFIQGLVGAAGVVGGSSSSASGASWVGNIMQMKYGRGDELESDEWGIELMMLAGYDPEELLEVMDILAKAGGAGGPEFMSTHPRPENRKEYIAQILKEIPQEIRDAAKRNSQGRNGRNSQPARGELDFDPNPNLDLDRRRLGF